MNYWKLLFSLLIVLTVFLIKSPALASEPSNAVYFSELFWSGSNISSSDEFIELKNNTAENLDISGWQITGINSSGEEFLMLTIPGGIIPAGGNYLIANSDRDYHYSKGESIINIKPDLVDSAITLSNDKLQINLYDGAWDDGRIPIDIAGDGGEPLAGDNDSKISMERILPPEDGTKPESWQNSSISKNLDDGATEIANPESSGKPEIITFSSDKSKLYLDGNSHEINFQASAVDSDGPNDIKSAEINLDELDDGKNQMNFEGGIYSFTTVINPSIGAGKKTITLILKDSKGLITTSEIFVEIYELSDDIKINEVYPKPADGAENEFIELYNNGKKEVNLSGWKLDDISDEGSNPYIIPNLIIAAEGYLAFYKKDTKIGLNDDGDIVRLINPQDEEVDIVSNYGKAKENCTYNKVSDGWTWSTTVTPNFENIITVPNNSSPSATSGIAFAIKQAKEQDDGIQVTVVGLVNSLPGFFSSLYFYIQDKEAGIQIYCHDKDFPSLSIGDKVKISGEISHTTSGTRLKIDGTNNIEIIEHNNEIIPIVLKTGELSGKQEGMLVQTSGKVIETSGSTFYIDDGTGTLKIYIVKSTGIKKPETRKGTFVEITGILTLYKNSWRLEPRSQSDLFVESAVKKESNPKVGIIEKAYAKEESDSDKAKIKNSTNSDKAKEINYSEINKHNLLIKLLEIVIIASTVLLIILIGDSYAREKNK